MGATPSGDGAPELVRAWIAAFNARDLDALLEVAHEEIVLDGDRRPLHGHAGVADLVARQRFGVRLYVGPQELHARGDVVAAVGPVELRQVVEDDRVVQRLDSVGAVFTVRDGRIVRYAPYASAAEALAQLG